jgi:peptide/nickel transport system ATP-binding protein
MTTIEEETSHIDATDETPVFETKNLKKWYSVRQQGLLKGLFSDGQHLKAVDGVDISIRDGEIVGLAGQSGSGKSTLGELLSLLQYPTEGTIEFYGKDITNLSGKELKDFRKQCQVIFQDPYESLNPRYTVLRTIKEPLQIHDIGTPSERINRAKEALNDAGLRPPEKYLDRYPNELSGGERQRVSIARALVLDPNVIIADEPTSMLDVSVSTGILNLFKDLQEKKDFSMLYISHDLGSINYIADRTMIMYLGDVVEVGPTNEVINNSTHPYTESLINAIPEPDAEQDFSDREENTDVPDPVNLPSGCRYREQCDYATDQCVDVEPSLESVSTDQEVACHHPLNIEEDIE